MLLLIYKQSNPFKYLVYKKSNRRPSKNGKIVCRHRGGSVKSKRRIIDYTRSLWNLAGIVVKIEYLPKSRKLLALILYIGGFYSYIIHIRNLSIGSKILSSNITNYSVGNSLYVGNCKYGVYVNNVESIPFSGSKFSRAAGSFCRVLNKLKTNKSLVKLKSGKIVRIPSKCLVTIGIISDFYHYYKFLDRKKNAGWNRRLGWRPFVRGVAMNAVDHPHGGGKGKKSGNAASMSPWGVLPKGKKTKKN